MRSETGLCVDPRVWRVVTGAEVFGWTWLLRTGLGLIGDRSVYGVCVFRALEGSGNSRYKSNFDYSHLKRQQSIRFCD